MCKTRIIRLRRFYIKISKRTLVYCQGWEIPPDLFLCKKNRTVVLFSCVYDKINDKNIIGAPIYILIYKSWETDKPYSIFRLHLVRYNLEKTVKRWIPKSPVTAMTSS